MATKRATARTATKAAAKATKATKAHAMHGAAASDAIASCACGTAAMPDEARHAVAVDPDVKARNTTRLRRIEGQVRGLQRMVEEDRYCADILMQISSVQEALRSVSRELMRNHLRHCAATAIRAGDGEAEPMYDELVELMFKHAR